MLADASASARAAQDVPAGHLRLTAPLDLGVGVLPLLLTRFRAQYPQIDIELLLTDTPLDLSAHRIDLALRATPGNLPDMSYRASALVNFHIGLYCSPGYLAEREPPSQPAHLAGHQLLACRERVGATTLLLNDSRGHGASNRNPLRNPSQRRSGPRQGAVVPRVSAQRADNPAATDLTAGAIAITLATAALPTPEPDATCRLN